MKTYKITHAKTLIIFISILVLDQFTKYLVRTLLSPFNTKTIIPGLFDLVYVMNKGGAFGILHRGQHGAAKRELFKNLIIKGRAMSFHSPKYGKNDDLRAILRTAVLLKCNEIALQKEQALLF